MMRRPARFLLAPALVLAMLCGGLAAQTFPLQPSDTSSPRATYGSFLADVEAAYAAGLDNDRDESQYRLERAVRLLDTAHLPPRFLRERATEAALMLKEVVDRLPRPDPSSIPGDGAADRWRIPQTEITIARKTEGPRSGEYLFTAETVGRMASFYAQVEDLPYVAASTPGIFDLYLTTPGRGLARSWSEQVPEWMKAAFAGQAIWQWLATVVVLLLATLLSVGLVYLGGRLDARHRGTAPEHGSWHQRIRPARILSVLVVVLIIFAAHRVIDEVINLTGTVLEVFTYILDAAGYVMLGWLAVLVVMSATHVLIQLRGLDPNAASGRLARLAATGFSALIVVALFVQAGQAFGLPAYSIVTGLGVGGIAIGFGAQALVRDIFSGIFFLVDDAFRPGEYIDTGAGKGFVEQVSIRSVQLRHHTGPLQTIPFGEIKKVNNFSRDWVVIKLSFRLPFGTDTEFVRKLIKNLGQDLLNDPEIGHQFLEPLKSQGIHDVDDFGIIMRVKFMTKPGEQFTLRRLIYLRIQELFRQNGIEFAGREVRVHGDTARDVVGNAAEIGAGEAKAL